MKEPLEIGRVVRSKAGRDAGRRFLIIGVADEAHVWIADGDLRKVVRPKKKKRKHLEGTKDIYPSMQTRLAGGGTIEDHEIRRLLIEEPKEEG